MTVEYLRHMGQKEDLIVNPNPGRPFITCILGVNYEFEPMRKYNVLDVEGSKIVSWARDVAANALQQSTAELNEYRRLLGSGNQGLIAKASGFVDKEGNTITKPWKRPPIVSLNGSEGRRFYADAVKECEELNIAYPKDDPEVKYVARDKSLVPPSEGWERQQYWDYIEGLGGLVSPAEKEDALYKKAKKLYDSNKKRYEALGIEVG